MLRQWALAMKQEVNEGRDQVGSRTLFGVTNISAQLLNGGNRSALSGIGDIKWSVGNTQNGPLTADKMLQIPN